tara:strand:+ start:4590 stop:5462 length:873 start_codon:yes stop_codon:yes gene_type:complete
MWTTRDQVDKYQLKYKEELFKQSEDAQFNQKFIEKLREYFRKAEERGQTHLAQALEKLCSPKELARRHLQQEGFKVSRSKPIFLYALMGSFFFVIFLGITFSVLSIWLLPKISKRVLDDEFSYSLYFDFNENMQNQAIQGTFENARGKTLRIPSDNIRLKVEYFMDSYIHYKCDLSEDVIVDQAIKEQGEQLLFRLAEKAGSIDCTLQVPQDLTLHILAENLNADFDQVSAPITIEATNANINIGLAPNLSYFPDIRPTRALVINQRKVNAASDGIPLRIAVENGKITFE